MNFVLGGLFYDENVAGAVGEAEFGYEVSSFRNDQNRANVIR
jgi:hypothetical protein